MCKILILICLSSLIFFTPVQSAILCFLVLLTSIQIISTVLLLQKILLSCHWVYVYICVDSMSKRCLQGTHILTLLGSAHILSNVTVLLPAARKKLHCFRSVNTWPRHILIITNPTFFLLKNVHVFFSTYMYPCTYKDRERGEQRETQRQRQREREREKGNQARSTGKESCC